MPKQIIIAEQHQIAAVFSEDQIQELVVATGHHQIGDIYLGVVENILPGIDAAFVNIGDPERNGFIHVTDLGPLKLKRTAAAITELLAPQQKVLVQVMKEPTGSKGPRLTGNITLPGRYVVLMPYGRGVNLSRRIKSESERNRLRALAILIKPAGMGLLVRTEAEGKPEEAIIEDLESLQKQWEAIQLEAQSKRPPALLNRDDDFIQRVLRDMYGADVNRIVVDSSTGLKRVKQYLTNWSGGQAPQGLLIDHHRDRSPILEYFRITAAIREALKPRVDLPSGGYIVIEPTEALTVIDVNSGSFTRSATARETVLWTNCEAATEIARQLRLRNLAGVIVVDFIDMESRRDQLQVLENFNKALKADKARPQIAQLTELGLVELTRKRQGQNIYELFGSPCPTCGGLGHILHLPGEGEKNGNPILEVAERSVSMPARERERERMPTPRVIESRDYESTPDVQETEPEFSAQNLLNHPSYQEMGDPNKRQTRRRRRLGGVNGANGKEEPRLGGTYTSNEPEDLIIEDVPEPPAPVAEVVSLPTITKQNTWIERGERSKPSKPEPVKPVVEPPEVVYVEMTPEEQDIYALMGISPMVRLEREVKNTKSVIVKVIAPGEQPAPETEAPIHQPERTQIEPITAPIRESIPVRQRIVVEREVLPERETEPEPEPEVLPERELEREPESESVAENTSVQSASEAVAEEDSRRRRRRRSSAMDNGI